MKLIIQIPCYNEAETLEIALNDLPRQIEGIDEIEYLIIDDGCKDNTVEICDNIPWLFPVSLLSYSPGIFPPRVYTCLFPAVSIRLIQQQKYLIPPCHSNPQIWHHRYSNTRAGASIDSGSSCCILGEWIPTRIFSYTCFSASAENLSNILPANNVRKTVAILI
mgnify:CR=1 FL=1